MQCRYGIISRMNADTPSIDNDAELAKILAGLLSPEPLGAYNFQVLRSILEMLSLVQIGRGVEIGVLDGGTSLFLLKAFPQLTLIGVDPDLSYHEYDQARMNAAEATALSRLEQFGNRSVRLKMTSAQAAPLVEDGSCDFVFIDADHTYDAVKEDIQLWYPKVRRGGLFCGHDLRWEGVTKAVVEFAIAQNMSGRYTPKESDIWWFIRP